MTQKSVLTVKLKKLCEEIVEVVNGITSESHEEVYESLHELETTVMFYRSLLSLYFTSQNPEQKSRILDLLRDSIIYQ